MKQIAAFLFSLLLIPFVSLKAQNDSGGGGGEGLKYEIFHVDLVPATFVYGAAELAFTEMMKSAMDKTIQSLKVTDSMFMKMVILEEKTQAYQRELQAHLLRSLNENYVDNRIKMIDENQQWMDDYIFYYPQYRDIVDECKKYVQGRAHNIKKFIDDVTKKTGNTGRLDNVQRNDLNLYVIDELKKLCYISQSLKRELSAINPGPAPFKIPTRE
jgi:hypothetical protein